ncbi:MAG: hypothetical protein OEY23_17575 [Acidimicrobiia bacterium]|nr:hypothetical protein [Acidimicrobiia bacterium]
MGAAAPEHLGELGAARAARRAAGDGAEQRAERRQRVAKRVLGRELDEFEQVKAPPGGCAPRAGRWPGVGREGEEDLLDRAERQPADRERGPETLVAGGVRRIAVPPAAPRGRPVAADRAARRGGFPRS